jgi:hypothetical protein
VVLQKILVVPDGFFSLVVKETHLRQLAPEIRPLRLLARTAIGDLVGIANSIEKKGSPPSVRRTGFPVVVL